MNNDYLDSLNPQQRDAVLYTDGPQLVIAGAGSGKTRVLTYKIVHLLHEGLDPHRIMALTFTNKAAREMRERIETLVGSDTARQLWMGTFHSIFSRLLRINAERIGFTHDFTIYDTSDSLSLIKIIIKDLQLDDKVYKPRTVQARISAMKNALFDPTHYAADAELRKQDNDCNRPLTYLIYETYWKRCRIAGAMDFDDLLFYTNILLRDNPDVLARYQEMFQYFLVDEYQDTNFAQHLIVLQLSGLHHRVCVVGDDAQSIYSFRGANITNILGLSRAYPGLRTFKLEQNYRSTQTIVNAAGSLIDKNKQQIKKNVFSRGDMGERIPVIRCFSDYEEAYVVANQITSIKAREGDSYEDFAVLYRTNAQSRELEDALSNGGRRDKHGNVRAAIPYRIYGGLSFYQRKEVKDAISYFRLSINPNDDEALRRVINVPARGIGETTVGKVAHSAMEHGVSMWEVIDKPQQYELSVNRGTLAKLNRFTAIIKALIALNQEGKNAYEVAKTAIERSALLSVLLNDNTPENISRQENINELLAAVQDFVQRKQEEGVESLSMNDFLAETSLLTDQDTNDTGGEKVTLMTVHSAKGLEFNNIIIVGVEEELFPATMSSDTLAGIEEERRLLYVAITRAKRHCIITYSTSRYRNGQTLSCVMSRFLRDIDPQYLRTTSTATNTGAEQHDWRTQRRQWNEITAPTPPAPPVRTPRTTPVDDSDEGPREPANYVFDPVTGEFREEGTTAPRQPVMPMPRRTRPVAPVAPRMPLPTSNPAAFRIYAAAELSVGQRIVHRIYGQGTINAIDESGDNPKVYASFDNDSIETRVLLLKFARIKLL